MKWGSVIFKTAVILGLLFILASVLWGVATREGLQGGDSSGEVDRYQEYRPAPYTSYVMVLLVVVGIVVMSISLYMDLRKKGEGTGGAIDGGSPGSGEGKSVSGSDGTWNDLSGGN